MDNLPRVTGISSSEAALDDPDDKDNIFSK